jgi:hypothetical protein
MENKINNELENENELMRRLVDTLEFKIMALELIKDKLIFILNDCKCNHMLNERQEIKQLVQKYEDLKQRNDTQLNNKSFINKNISKEVMINNNNNNNNNSNNECDNCFVKTNEINRRIETKNVDNNYSHNRDNNKLVKSKLKSMVDRFSCSWPGCDHKVDHKYQLKSHLLSHTGEKPFLCDWPGCEKRYFKCFFTFPIIIKFIE